MAQYGVKDPAGRVTDPRETANLTESRSTMNQPTRFIIECSVCGQRIWESTEPPPEGESWRRRLEPHGHHSAVRRRWAHIRDAFLIAIARQGEWKPVDGFVEGVDVKVWTSYPTRGGRS